MTPVCNLLFFLYFHFCMLVWYQLFCPFFGTFLVVNEHFIASAIGPLSCCLHFFKICSDTASGSIAPYFQILQHLLHHLLFTPISHIANLLITRWDDSNRNSFVKTFWNSSLIFLGFAFTLFSSRSQTMFSLFSNFLFMYLCISLSSSPYLSVMSISFFLYLSSYPHIFISRSL